MRLPVALRGLRRRNLQLFFSGQLISLIGTWMQQVAVQWLVWRLTHSAPALGLVTFLGQFPVFLLGTLGGSVADQIPRRRLVVVTQVAATVQALALAIVTLARVATPALVMVLITLLGIINAFDIPARQALLSDLAETDLGNAIAINSSIVNGTRMIGPAIAGWLVALVGEGYCFLGNALSYGAIVASLLRMQVPAQVKASGAHGHLRAGLRYAVRTPHVRTLLMLVATTSMFGLSYTALMPVFAARVLGGDARLLGTLLGAVGLGALVAAITLLNQQGLRGLGRRVAWGATLLGVGLLGLASSRWVALSEISLFCTGAGFMFQLTSTNTLLQTLAPPALRGRVMGLYSTLFIGMTPLGALAAGWMAARIGAPRTVGVGAVVVLFASVAFHLALPGLRKIVTRDYPSFFPPELA
ncbi:MAG TPA: MFS transporter [Polyangia bacterium]|nr:MFS transporter [Polyangia bacterium]